MTPIEKASKLTSYYLPFCNDNITDAKYCALIAVDEIIKSNPYEVSKTDMDSTIEYWQEVKKEIYKL